LGRIYAMDPQSLKAFLLVAETRSFSLAAERLHLTQPAVSKRVASLEKYLGNELFDRLGRKVSLTETGHALLPHAEAIFQSIQDAEIAVRDLSGTVTGSLSLATSHHIGLHKLPRVLKQFAQRYPAVSLDLEFMDSERAYDLMQRGKIELAVVTLDPNIDDSFEAVTIWPDPLHLAMSPDHPLANCSNISLQTLSEHPAILPGLNTYTGQIVKGLFDEEGLDLNVTMSTNYLETIKMMVSIGLGWSILPMGMLTPPIVSQSLGRKQLERQLGYVYHRKRSLSNAGNAFISELLAHRQP
jgi:DNA-binding transcriptional LysR family regulator